MALFRDRRVFPRWSFIDSRSLARPRYARDENSAESVPTPPEPPTEPISGPEVEVWREPQNAAAPVESTPSFVQQTSAPVVQGAFVVHAAEPEGPDVLPQRAIPEVAPVSWIEERRNWFAESDWPTEASEESVQLAGTHPDRPYVAPLHPGLPAVSPAEVRASHGRGFSSMTRRHRRRRHAHEQAQRRADIDLVALEAALDDAAQGLGDGLVHLVVWHAVTGLPLASRGESSPEVASVWHGATRDVRATLPHADLPDSGSYHLVGLAGRRLAILLHVHPDLGACVTVDLELVAVDTLLATAVPQLSGALAATSREY
jgi:hypothetical protein